MSVSCECCQVEVTATGWSLVQRSPTECVVSECDREASTMRRPWPTRGCCAIGSSPVTWQAGTQGGTGVALPVLDLGETNKFDVAVIVQFDHR
jgi:hypothetical protein